MLCARFVRLSWYVPDSRTRLLGRRLENADDSSVPFLCAVVARLPPWFRVLPIYETRPVTSGAIRLANCLRFALLGTKFKDFSYYFTKLQGPPIVKERHSCDIQDQRSSVSVNLIVNR